jgi:nucleotide-binding universal stress UspA family protein
METFKRILVPVDFSPCSREALGRAAALAARLDASIDLLHVWQPPPVVNPETMLGTGPDGPGLVQLAREQADHAMGEFVKQARDSGMRIEKFSVEPGDPARTIVDAADRGDYDLIAMGTHGRTGLAHLLLGSVAEKVIRRATRPVMTVREEKAH